MSSSFISPKSSGLNSLTGKLTASITGKLTRKLTGEELNRLFLEKFKLTLGSELVVNGTFEDGSTGWDVSDAGWSVANGKLNFSGSSNGWVLTDPEVNPVVGKTYSLSLDVSDFTSSGWNNISFGGSHLAISQASAGSYSYNITATSTARLAFYGTGGADFSLDNISVKEVTKQAPLAAFSLRKLGDVSPYAARIRRSFDNTEAQVMFDASDRVSESSVVRNTSQNLIPFSEQFSLSDWIKFNISVTPSSITDPFGGTNAYKYAEASTASNNKLLLDSHAVSSGKSYTLSLYAKKGELEIIQLILGNVGFAGGNNHANFNLTSGTVTATGGACIPRIESVGDDWYRISITDTTSASGNVQPTIVLHNSATGARASSYTGNGTDGVYIFGCQSEETVTYESTNGTEKVTNGDFDTDSDWSKNTGWSIGSGVASCDGTNASDVYQNVGMSAGKNYKISIEVKSITSGSVNLLYYNGSSFPAIKSALPLGESSYTFSPPAGTNGHIYINSANFVGSVDNVSALEYDPIPSEYISTPVVSNDGLTFTETTLDDFVGGENYFTHSEFTSGWAWYNNLNSTPTLNAGTDPLGGNTAVKIVNDSGNELKLLRPSTTPTATTNNTYTASLYVKDAGARYLVFYLSDSASRKLNVDVQTGQIASFNGSGGSGIEDVGNGWFRVHFTHTMTDTMGSISIVPSNSNYDLSLAGNGTDGLLIWGAQFNTGATLKTYQATTGTARDGNASVVVLYNQTGGEDAIQSTTGHQPLLYNAGLLVRSGSSPSMDFADAHHLEIDSLIGISVLDSYYLTDSDDTRYTMPASHAGSASGLFFIDGSSNSVLGSSDYGANRSIFVNGAALSPTTSDGLYEQSKGRSIVTHLNCATTHVGWGKFNIGKWGYGSSDNFEGKISEMIFFDSNQSANRVSIESDINDFHNIF